jgi:SAM-dependent methyltransferase
MTGRGLGQERGRDCPLCGGSGRAGHLSGEGFTLQRCLSCGMVFQDAPMDIEGVYSEGYFSGGYMAEGNPERLASTAKDILSRLGRHVGKGRILDVGAGPGYYVQAAAGEGWEAYGVEVSPFAAGHAKEALGLEVVCGTLDEAHFPDGRFDAAMMVHVVEHIPEPVATMMELNRVMRTGGALYLSTPNITSRRAKKEGASWWALKPGEHILFFSPKTVTMLLERSGFEIVEMDTNTLVVSTEGLKGLGLPVGEGFREFVNRHFKGPKEAIRRLAGKLIQGESINVVAVKR